MTSAAEKKRMERWALEHLRRLLPSFPEGAVIPEEEPDFIVVLDSGKRIGIEITELHREVAPGELPPQSQEALKLRIVRRAKEIYDATDGPFVEAAIFFADVEVSRADVPVFAKRIADLVAALVPRAGETRTAETDCGDEDFPEELHHLRVYTLPDADRSFFSSPGSTWVATLSDDDLKRALSSKNGKYNRYRTKADEVWLLISCNGGFMSTWFQRTEDFHGREFETHFDRVLLISHFDQRIVELGRKGASTA